MVTIFPFEMNGITKSCSVDSSYFQNIWQISSANNNNSHNIVVIYSEDGYVGAEGRNFFRNNRNKPIQMCDSQEYSCNIVYVIVNHYLDVCYYFCHLCYTTAHDNKTLISIQKNYAKLRCYLLHNHMIGHYHCYKCASSTVNMGCTIPNILKFEIFHEYWQSSCSNCFLEYLDL